mmetsp:Transcript_23615/g.49459  ORF Transcript_23615/g.49459 Transcript_23615/m.49459 type:complete len:488 (+) Transcript_23615:77-1540(+)
MVSNLNPNDEEAAKETATWKLLYNYINNFAKDEDYTAYASIVQQATGASSKMIEQALLFRASQHFERNLNDKKTLVRCDGDSQEDDAIAASTTSTYTCQYTEEYCKSVLVTGGVGFVGSHIVETLLREGTKVVIYDIFNSETTISDEKREIASILRQAADDCADIGAELDIIHGDIRDKEHLMRIISSHGITACVHVGGMVDDRRSVFHPDEYIDVNIRGTATLLDALGKSGVKMVVQASTRSVFGQRENNETHLTEKADRRPVNPYGASKVGADAMGHCYSNLYQMNVTLIRIFANYGPRGRPDMIPRILCENIADGKPIRKFGDGSATRTWIYISDIVSAFLLALRNPCNGYAEFNTGAPNSTTLNEMISCAERVAGRKATIEQCEVPPGDAHTVGHPSYELIQQTLGWTPKVTVEEGMRLTYLDYFRRKKERAAHKAMAEQTIEHTKVHGEQVKEINGAVVVQEEKKTSLQVVMADTGRLSARE